MQLKKRLECCFLDDGSNAKIKVNCLLFCGWTGLFWLGFQAYIILELLLYELLMSHIFGYDFLLYREEEITDIEPCIALIQELFHGFRAISSNIDDMFFLLFA